ncbi:hypothetical protein JXQ31_14505 [candidate division KSB1 bacterium]|nr:hypothetical protein [candidate division KSB1 bacterium]
MKKLKITILYLLIIFISLPCFSQERFPREYTPPEELCSINGQLEFQDAMNILSEYSIQFANKPIFDPTKQKGSVGIDVDALQWEKALQIILSARGLWYEEKEHFFQIVYPTNTSTISNGSTNIPDEINLRPGSKEIKIETIFFEGDRKAISEIGLDWSSFYNGKVTMSSDQMGALSVNESFFDLSVKIPSKTFDVDIRALLSIFDSKNIGKVLAQPQVVVTEGNEGKIQVGQDFSIKTRDFAGNLIDRFFSTGTILQVTPYIIMDDDKNEAILLKAHVERSQATPDVVSTIINKSEANSYIQLFDGEETLIAGLYNTEKTNLRKGLPLLKDLPPWFFGLCYLFGYNRTETSQKELIIILKASILPDVFDRKNYPNNQNLWDPDAELKLEKFKKGTIEPGIPKREVSNTYTPKPKPVNKAIEKKTYVPQPRAQATPVMNPEKTIESANYYLGNVISVEDNIVLIKWKQNFNTQKLFGKRFSTVRLNGNKKPIQVGYVLIQQTKYDRTIAHKIKGDVRPGDLIVIKIKTGV